MSVLQHRGSLSNLEDSFNLQAKACLCLDFPDLVAADYYLFTMNDDSTLRHGRVFENVL